jgi:hypothetical protein
MSVLGKRRLWITLLLAVALAGAAWWCWHWRGNAVAAAAAREDARLLAIAKSMLLATGLRDGRLPRFRDHEVMEFRHWPTFGKRRAVAASDGHYLVAIDAEYGVLVRYMSYPEVVEQTPPETSVDASCETQALVAWLHQQKLPQRSGLTALAMEFDWDHPRILPEQNALQFWRVHQGVRVSGEFLVVRFARQSPLHIIDYHACVSFDVPLPDKGQADRVTSWAAARDEVVRQLPATSLFRQLRNRDPALDLIAVAQASEAVAEVTYERANGLPHRGYGKGKVDRTSGPLRRCYTVGLEGQGERLGAYLEVFVAADDGTLCGGTHDVRPVQPALPATALPPH